MNLDFTLDEIIEKERCFKLTNLTKMLVLL